MIELPPPLFLPAKPAIIRPAGLLRPQLTDRLRYVPASFLPGMFPAGGVMGGAAAAPIAIEAANTSSTAGAGTSATVNLPASIAAGELLLALINSRDPGTGAISGWSSLAIDTHTNAYLQLFYKTATGSEGATATWTSSNSVQSAHATWRISGWQGTPENGAKVTGGTNNPDPPSITPSWGSARTLFLTAFGSTGTAVASGAPTNYSGLLTAATSGASNVAINAATRILEGTTDDPGAFTASLSGATWVAQTFAIRPA